MYVGTQATMPEEQTRMLGELPVEVCRVGERIRNTTTVSQAAERGVKSIWMCREYGSLRTGAASGLAANAWRIELGNEPYWEGVSITSFAREVADILERTPDRTRFTVACMEGTNYSPAKLLAADSRLARLIGGSDGAALSVHPYDAYGTGPAGPSNTGTPLKSGGLRWKETHDSFVRLTGREVKINATEFGWCTPPYQPGSLPLVEEGRAASWIVQQLKEMEAAGYVESGCVYHYAGYYNSSSSKTNTVSYNGLWHREDQERYIAKRSYTAFKEYLLNKRPVTPPPPPFEPAEGDTVMYGTGPTVTLIEPTEDAGGQWLVYASTQYPKPVWVVPTSELRPA